MSGESVRTTVTETRKLAAIMLTDIEGFSRQMGADEARTLQRLDTHNRLIQHAASEHHGTVIKTIGDAFLVDFPSVVHAVQCAQEIQAQFHAYNAEKETAEQIHIRIGIHLGDIVQKDGDVFGDGVNIAARLQALAEPDTICISEIVYKEVVKKIDLGALVSLGRPQLKNITERFQVYALLSEAPKRLQQKLQVQRLKLSHRLRPAHRIVAAGLLLIAGTAVAVRHFSYFSPDTHHASRNTSESLPLPDKPSIAVLPFTNMSGDPEQEYFSDGLTDTLITALSQISGLFVIARNSTFTYKGKAVKVREVGRELGVRYVLEGGVQKAEERVRLNVQLIDAQTGGHLWAERYDRQLTDVFAVQDDITQKIVETLKIRIMLREQGALVNSRTTDSLEAYDAYLRGMERFWRYTKEANVQARQLYERALALDPTYAEAYVWLGSTYGLDHSLGWNPGPEALQQALELSQKALSLNDALPLGYVQLGNVYLFQKQHERAIVALEQCLALNPNYAPCYASLGWVLTWAGRSGEAVEKIEQAMRLDPFYPFYYSYFLGQAYHFAGRYEEAIAVLKNALSRNPDFMPAHRSLAVIYSELGRETEARAAAAEILRINPDFSVKEWGQTVPYKDQPIVKRHMAALYKAGLK